MDALGLFNEAMDRPCVVEGEEDVGPAEESDGEFGKELEMLLLHEPLRHQSAMAHDGVDRKILSKQEQRDRLHRRKKRATQRRRSQEAAGTSLKKVAIQRAVQSKVARARGMDLASAPHASTGYIGKWGSKRSNVKAPSNGASESLESLEAKGFQYVPWNG